ncbi:MAG TPA: saccharopine dehydrogenase C-terminal domain-containing protein [Longimicrobiaceae bacterium]|nr:saccharopine dehydrogenase C-terminal domain-containing protein [Longimicrobiaceae bacterium]
MNVIVLGAGRVGCAIARDLARGGEFAVTAADLTAIAYASLQDQEGILPVKADLSDPVELERLLHGQDLVIGALPGFLGFETLRRVIELGKHVVDISFFDEDAFALDELARERGVVACVDCGVAPGASSLILGHLESALDETERFACYVGGLPAVRSWPYEYKAPFSPLDVIEEYTRPARMRREGQPLTLPALSEVELLDFPGIGTLEAFNTDGLRTLLRTSRTPTLIEKTLRYPGHAERMRMLRESGFFGEEPVEIGGTRLRPRDLTAKLLFQAWRFEEGEEDLTVMRIEVEGRREGRRVTHVFRLLDRYHPGTGTSSMARTTGYTCAAVARLIARGLYTRPGITPPELLGREPGCYEFVMNELAARGVRFEEEVLAE